MTTCNPPLYAAHQLADGRWELIGPDDDPYRPPWRRWLVVSSGSAPALDVAARLRAIARAASAAVRRRKQ